MSKKVLIYEDNETLRQGLEELLPLSEEYIISGSYGNCLEVNSQLINDSPDVILMDIDLPGMSGIEAIKRIRKVNQTVAIIVLTVFDDNKNVFDAICAGASGYLLKKNVSEKLIPFIQDVLEGGAPMSPSIAKMVISAMQHTQSDYKLSERELIILQLLCKGNSYKMIGAETKLTFETVRSYVKKIYEKLQVHSATEAVSKAINEKLI